MSKDDDVEMADAFAADQSSSSSLQKISNQNQSSSSSSHSQQQTLAQELRNKNYSLDILPELMQDIRSTDFNKQLNAAVGIRKLLSIEKNPPIQEVIDANLVPVLMNFLKSDSYPMQFECLWALTNIASGNTEQTKVVVDQGAIKEFIQLLKSPNEDVCEQAIWALGNISGDSPQYRDMCLDEGALSPLLEILLNKNKLSILRNGTWMLSNLCRGKPAPNYEKVKLAIPMLARLIYSADQDVQVDALWAISYISDGENQRIQDILEAKVARRLVEFLSYPQPTLIVPALRTIGNIVTGDDLQTQVMINLNVVELLMKLISHQKKGIRKEALWTLSNITAGNSKQIEYVISHTENVKNIIKACLCEPFDVAKEAVWTLANACQGATEAQTEKLADAGVIACLVQILTKKDSKTLEVALEGLKCIFSRDKESRPYVTKAQDENITDHLTKLLNHKDISLAEKTKNLLDNYFNDDINTKQESISDATLAQINSRRTRDSKEEERDN